MWFVSFIIVDFIVVAEALDDDRAVVARGVAESVFLVVVLAVVGLVVIPLL